MCCGAAKDYQVETDIDEMRIKDFLVVGLDGGNTAIVLPEKLPGTERWWLHDRCTALLITSI